MDEIVITDDQLVHFNKGSSSDNSECSLLYGDNHKIDLAQCARNYNEINSITGSLCVAERNICEFTITFYTCGMLTKVYFKKRTYRNWLGKRLLSGDRTKRFHTLTKLILECGYTTYDMS